MANYISQAAAAAWAAPGAVGNKRRIQACPAFKLLPSYFAAADAADAAIAAAAAAAALLMDVENEKNEESWRADWMWDQNSCFYCYVLPLLK